MIDLGLRARLADERGILVASLVKMVIVFAILAVAANEIGQVVMAKVRAENAAGAAAQAAADSWAMGHDVDEAKAAALEAAKQDDPTVRITAFTIDRTGTVTVADHTTAHTLLLERIGFLQHLGVQTAVQSGTHGI